ncbi:MAG: hypothetical protein IJD22_03800 [Clostridia bacterium]|nr:hypothetical protein [Clostridia bacterium]
MKRLIIALLSALFLLSSCASQNNDLEDSKAAADTTESLPQAIVTTETVTTEKAPELPVLVGLYVELNNDGNYTRLNEWHDEWVKGKDIAVFDVIPSAAESLYSRSYTQLWKQEAEKISPGTLPKPYLNVYYQLNDGTEINVDITSWKEAEGIIADGYIEIYLYDDIHQDGGWYSHLTEGTTDSETVISSVKITAGNSIEEVNSIIITAYIDGSSPASVSLFNGQ